MLWNWQSSDWPAFDYATASLIDANERSFTNARVMDRWSSTKAIVNYRPSCCTAYRGAGRFEGRSLLFERRHQSINRSIASPEKPVPTFPA